MSINYDSTINTPLKEHQQNKPTTATKKSKWGSTCVTLALAINTILLLGVLIVVAGVRGRVDETLTKVDKIVDAVESGKPDNNMLDFTNKLLSSATSYFFLGNFDGTVAGFLENVLLYDFSGFASQFVSFSNTVTPQFSGSTDSVSKGIVTALNAIKSVATQVAQFQNVQGNQAANAALSDGIFRLDHMLEFLRSQADPAAWKDAGTVCKSFSTSMKSVTWTGSYTDSDGMVRSWDITSTMTDVTDRMDTICGKLSQISV